jgi:hypothetical protein
MKRTTFAIVVSSISVAGLPAYSATSIDLYPATSSVGGDRLLGGWLEGEFQTMVGDCTGSPPPLTVLPTNPVAIWDHGRNVSAVPVQLVIAYHLDRSPAAPSSNDHISRVYSLGHQTLNALFATVRTSSATIATVDGDLPPGSPGLTGLSINALPQDLQIALPQFDGLHYTLSCANSMSFAFNADANYQLPVASMKAALGGGISAAQSNNVELYSGTFYSPFVAMWAGQYIKLTAAGPVAVQLSAFDEPPLRTYASLLFWDWWNNNLEKLSKDNYILEYFSGVATAEDTLANSSLTANASASATLTMPWVSANLKASASRTYSDTFSKDAFDLAAFRDGKLLHPGSRYFVLPTPEQIHAAMLSIKPRLTLGNIEPLNPTPIQIIDALPVDFSQYTYGVVEPFCGDQKWTLDTNDTRLAFKQSHITPDAAGIPVCEFDLEFTPTAADLRSATSVDVQVRRTDAIPVNGSNVPFEFSSTRVAFAPYLRGGWKPLTRGLAVPIDPMKLGSPLLASASELEWSFQFQYDPAGTSASAPANPQIENYTVSCDGNKPPFTAISPNVAASNQPGMGLVYSVTLDAGIPPGTNLIVDPSQRPQCKFNGTVTYSFTVSGKTYGGRLDLKDLPISYPIPLS